MCKSRLPVLLVGAMFAALTLSAAENSPLQPRHTPAPAYPEALLDEAKTGQVKVTFTVGVDGRVHDVVVDQSDDPLFTAAVQAVLPEWEFTPATKAGEPVHQRVGLPFVFKPSAEDLLNKMLGRKVFVKLDGEPVPVRELGERPKPTKRTLPVYPRAKRNSGEEPSVRVRFVIGRDGLTYNPEVIDEVDKAFVLPALAAVAQMQFKPIKRDGEAIAVGMMMPIRFRDVDPEEMRRRPMGPGGGGGGGGGGDGDGGF